MGWLEQWREAREARGRRIEEELGQLHGDLHNAVVRLMSHYDCQVQQVGDQIEVRGGPGTCPFDIWMPDIWVNLAAGDRGEYVLEWVLSRPGELEDMVALLQQIVTADLANLPSGSNNVRLEGCSAYPRLTAT